MSVYNENERKSVEYQAHPFHMVSPSPWPILTSSSLLSLAVSGAFSMHVFVHISKIFFSSLALVVYSMCLWFRDVIVEGT